MALMTRVLKSLMPPGPIHRNKIGGKRDAFEQGMGANLQAAHDFIAQVAFIRVPALTPVLSDLEQEFGVSPSDGATIAQRVNVLTWRMFSRGLKGQYWTLQNAINQAGFTGINVIPNDPAVNPAPFIAGSAQVNCGSFTNSYCGYYTGLTPPSGPYNAFCALYGGTLVVNGAQYVNNSKVVGCGSGVSCHPIWAGLINTNICGTYVYSQAQIVNYGPPSDYWRWPLVFFIGGTATFDGAGHLTGLTQCVIPKARMAEFLSLVLHFKPIHSWAALVFSN